MSGGGVETGGRVHAGPLGTGSPTAPGSVRVRALSFTPVKGTRLRSAEAFELGRDGVASDRRYYVVDERGRMLNAKVLGELQAVLSELTGAGALRLTFPDGRVVEAEPRDGASIRTRFYSQSREHRLVEGPWSDALSQYLERPVRLVHATTPGRAVDRGARGAVSLISRASLETLAAEAELDSLDARRFRMLVEVDGLEANEEDAWVGRRVRVGAALVRFHGHVGRCLITSRDPESGVIDVPTLDVLAGYRGNLETTEPLAFGVYGEVIEPGSVRLGDGVTVEG